MKKQIIPQSLSTTQEVVKELKRYKFVVLVFVLVVAVLSFALLKAINTQFVVVQGYNGDKYQVYMHRVDPRFLLEKTIGNAYAFFDVTPSTVGMSDAVFLTRLTPRAYSAIKPKLMQREHDIKHNGQSQFFVPELGGKVNIHDNTVIIKGMLHRIIGSEELEPKKLTVSATYEVNYGDVQLSGWSVSNG